MDDRIDEADLARIYNETIGDLYAFISRRCIGERELTEDVVQETWFRALRDWDAHGVPSSPIGWLKTAGRNLLISHYRKHVGVLLERLTGAEVLAAVDADAVADSAEVVRVVNQALSRIPTAEAQLLETFHYDGLKTSELARLYGISERAIEGRLRRARQRLRRELEATLKMDRGLI